MVPVRVAGATAPVRARSARGAQIRFAFSRCARVPGCRACEIARCGPGHAHALSGAATADAGRVVARPASVPASLASRVWARSLGQRPSRILHLPARDPGSPAACVTDAMRWEDRRGVDDRSLGDGVLIGPRCGVRSSRCWEQVHGSGKNVQRAWSVTDASRDGAHTVLLSLLTATGRACPTASM